MRLILPLLALLSIAAPAWGQERTCKALDQMKAHLASEYREVETGGGISDDGTIVLLFQSRQDSTFTVVKVTPRKLACVVDFGTSWQTRSDPAPVPETGL